MACEICKTNSRILIGLFVFICFISSSIAATTQNPAVQIPDTVTNTTTNIISGTTSTQSVDTKNGSDVKSSPLPDKQTLGSNGTIANTTEAKLHANITTTGLTSSSVTTTSPNTLPTLPPTLPVILPSPSTGNNDTNSTTSSATSAGPNTTTIIPTPDISTTPVTSTTTDVSKTTMVTPVIMPTNLSSTSTEIATTPTSNATMPTSTTTKVAPTTVVPPISPSTKVAPTSTATKGVSSSTSTVVATSLISTSQTKAIQTSRASETTITAVLRTKETTEASNTNGQADGRNQCKESQFGKIGLFAFIALAVLCVILLLVLVFILIKFKRKKKESQLPVEETAAPKLKMLEIKDTPVKTYSNSGGAQDGLQTYSLDYEKYVQQKKEEHKRKIASISSTDANGPAVSSFLIGKRPLVMQTTSDSSSSSNAGPNSPRSPSGTKKPGSHPGTLAEKKPLMGDEEPVVFNFTKTPGESLAARRASKPDTEEKRRGSSSSTKATKGLELSPDNFTLDL